MSDFIKIFPTRTGSSIGDASENRMIDNVGGVNQFRTKIMMNNDGSTTMLRTRGGFPEFVTIKAPKVSKLPIDIVSTSVTIPYQGGVFQDDVFVRSNNGGMSFNAIAHPSISHIASHNLFYIGDGRFAYPALLSSNVRPVNQGSARLNDFQLQVTENLESYGSLTGIEHEVSTAFPEPLRIARGNSLSCGFSYTTVAPDGLGAGSTSSDIRDGTYKFFLDGTWHTKTWTKAPLCVGVPVVQRVGQSSLLALIPVMLSNGGLTSDPAALPFFSLSNDNGLTWTDMPAEEIFTNLLDVYSTATSNVNYYFGAHTMRLITDSFVSGLRNGEVFAMLLVPGPATFVSGDLSVTANLTYKLIRFSESGPVVMSELPGVTITDWKIIGGSAAGSSGELYTIPGWLNESTSSYAKVHGNFWISGSVFMFHFRGTYESRIASSPDGITWTYASVPYGYTDSGCATAIGGNMLSMPVFNGTNIDGTVGDWVMTVSIDRGVTWSQKGSIDMDISRPSASGGYPLRFVHATFLFHNEDGNKASSTPNNTASS